MSYEVAINKAWEELAKFNPPDKISVKFMADEYEIDFANKSITSLSCNTKAKDFTAILLLHYLAKKLSGLPQVAGEWCDFRELSGVEGYADAFKKRSLEPIIRKYGKNPDGILTVLERLPAKRVYQGDIGIAVDAFIGVPALIMLWRPDEEFGPEANILFDRSISKIFCIEDIVVLAGMIASSL
jgi:hypothetical protein